MTGVNLGGGSAVDLASLVKIIGSDSDYGKKIKDLTASEKNAKDALDKLRAVQGEIAASRKQITSDFEKLNAEREAHQKLASEFATHKTNYNAGLAEREAKLRDAENALAGKKSAHDDQAKQATAVLAEREAKVDLKERELTAIQARIEKDSKRLYAKLQKMAEAESI